MKSRRDFLKVAGAAVAGVAAAPVAAASIADIEQRLGGLDPNLYWVTDSKGKLWPLTTDTAHLAKHNGRGVTVVANDDLW